MIVTTNVKSVPEYEVHITGLTKDDVQALSQGLNFLSERLPDGLSDVMLSIQNDLDDVLRRSEQNREFELQ